MRVIRQALPASTAFHSERQIARLLLAVNVILPIGTLIWNLRKLLS